MHAAGENAAAFRAEPVYRFQVAQPVQAALDSSGGRFPVQDPAGGLGPSRERIGTLLASHQAGEPRSLLRAC
jgi:hypothetical protein